MTPERLFRVTLPGSIEISQDGYFQPHNKDSKFGNSIPMIERKHLLPIAYTFGNWNQFVSDPEANKFLVMCFRSDFLNIVDKEKHSWRYAEYWAEAPLRSLISVMRFQWLSESKNLSPKRKENFGKAVKYLGHYTNKDILKLSEGLESNEPI